MIIKLETQTSKFHNLLQNYNNQDSIQRHKETHIDQWNRIENQEINPYIYGQLIFGKSPETIKWGKIIVFSTNGSEQLDIHM